MNVTLKGTWVDIEISGAHEAMAVETARELHRQLGRALDIPSRNDTIRQCLDTAQDEFDEAEHSGVSSYRSFQAAMGAVRGLLTAEEETE